MTPAPEPGENDLAPRFEACWRRFRDAVGRLDHAQFAAVTTGWTAKEMVAHVAFWQEAMEPVVVGMLRGDQVRGDVAFGSGYAPEDGAPWPDADVHNAREAAWATPRAPAEVVARLDAAHARSLALVHALTGAEVADPRFRQYVLDTCEELDAHLPELLALLGPNP